MNGHHQTSMLAGLERYLKPWDEDFALAAMSDRVLDVWDLRQMLLTDRILVRVRKLIEGTPAFSRIEKEELARIVDELLNLGMSDFIRGMKANPIHHNLQVVENTLRICIGEAKPYPFVKRATILALLHDIGNGWVDPSLEKIKTSDLKEKKKELLKQGVAADDVFDRPSVRELFGKAKAYRMAHMTEGAKRAPEVLAHLNQRFVARLGRAVVDDAEIKDIVGCIKIHDAPSIAECYAELRRPVDLRWLIPFGNELASVLREADRLWMVSREGLEKDLVDDLTKKRKTGDAKGCCPDAMAKLKHNVKRFREEYDLYVSAKKVSAQNLGVFKGATLFRTETGFSLFLREIVDRVEEIVGPGRRVNVAASLGGSKLGIAYVFAGGVIVEFIKPFDWRQRFGITHEETSHADVLKDGVIHAGVQAFRSLERAVGQSRIGKYGIACKGPLKITKDHVKVLGPGKKLTTLPFQDYPLEDRVRTGLAKQLAHVPQVELLHDGVAAILGEVAPGGTLASRRNAAAVIIGTGVGIGILENGAITHEELGSIGRFLVYVPGLARVPYKYTFVRSPAKRKEPIRDVKELQDCILGKLRSDPTCSCGRPKAEERFKDGINHFSARVAGSWLAKRLAAKCVAGGKSGRFWTALCTASRGMLAFKAVQKFDPDDPDKDVEKRLLVSLTLAAVAGSAAARQFIRSIGEEIGRALGTLMVEFRNEPFVHDIVLVSSIAENLGKDVKGYRNSEDIFMDAIRKEAKKILTANAMSSELASNIKRSRISYEREYLAFTPV